MEKLMEQTPLKTKANTKTGSHAILNALKSEGVNLVFGYPGGAIMPFYDALLDVKEEIHHVLVRHEQGAAHAAQGYARSTGKVGVCIATSGPGATNLITGIADAMIDSTPLVCITGQVAQHLLGTDAFQETDIVGISTPVTKWNYQITRAAEIDEVMAKAFFIARSGRPGPVLIDITKNAQTEFVESDYKRCTEIRSYQPNPMPSIEAIEAAASLIQDAKKPLVVFGQGVVLGNAENELQAFIEKTGIPAVSTLLGLSALSSKHPLYMGWVGMHGNYGPNKLTNECDVLIAIGMRFDDRVTGDVKQYATQAKIIHLDIDPSEIDKNVVSTVALVGDCKLSLDLLTALVEPGHYTSWINQFYTCFEVEYDSVIQKDLSPIGKIKMAEVIQHLSDLTEGEAVLVTDVGQHQMIAQRYYQFSQRRSNITSGGLGTMGFALPAAMGAKMGVPQRQVIAVVGDGGFQMTLQELATIRQENLAVKIVVLNNEYLGMVRQWQELFFNKRYSGTPMENPDFISVAKGFGIEGKRIAKREDLTDGLKEMLAATDAFILEICVEKEDNVFPMIPTGCSVSEVRLK